MTIRRIVRDKSYWKRGSFFLLEIPNGDIKSIEEAGHGLRRRHGGNPLVACPERDEHTIYLESVGEDRTEYIRCSCDFEHVRYSVSVGERFELWGEVAAPLVGMRNSKGLCFSKGTNDIIEQSDIVGYTSVCIPQQAVQAAQGQDELAALPFYHHRPLNGTPLSYVTEDGYPAICPCCGKNVICPVCNRVDKVCTICKRPNVATPGDEIRGQVFLWEPTLDIGFFGAHWNGEDFVGGLVSGRVMKILESIHAYPYAAISVPVDTRGMTEEQLELLEKYRRE